MKLNSKGEWCGGVGGTWASFMGEIVANPAGGTSFIDDDHIIYQVCNNGCIVEKYNVRTKTKSVFHNSGAFDIYGGGGRGAIHYDGASILDNSEPPVTTFHDVEAAIGPVGPDGAVAIKDKYQSYGPWSVIEKSGERWQLTPGDAQQINLLGDKRAVFIGYAGLTAIGVPTPKTCPGIFWWMRCFAVNGEWWILYQREDGSLVTHPFSSTVGYLLAPAGSMTYRPDAIQLANGMVRVVFAWREDEHPSVQIVRDYDFSAPRVELVPPPVHSDTPPHTDIHVDAPHTDTPPHSDAPPHTDTPSHTDAPKPMPPLKTSERYWLHPNIDSVDLVESLHADLATVDVFGLYAQWILDDSRWDRIDTLEGIRSQGVNLAIEMSCIMEGDPHGEGTRATFPQIAERVRSKGHRVNWLCMDEPITKAKKNFPTMGIDEVGFAIVKWMEEARKQFPGVKIVLIEAWPEIELDQMRKCLMVLDSWGQHLDGWHLDIDRRRAVKERKDMHAMVKKAKEYADQYKAALGVKFAGYSYLTDAEYRADVEAFAKDVAEKEHFAVDHICIQSWAERAIEPQHGPQDLPANLTQDGLFVTFGYIQENVFQ